MLFTGRSSIPIDQLHRPAHQGLSQFCRVSNGGTGSNDAGRGTIESAHPEQTSHQIRHMRTKNAGVGMKFIQYDVFQVTEELNPLGVIGKHSRMQHIWIGDDDASPLPGRHANGRRCVPIKGVNRNSQIFFQKKIIQRGLLILA